MRVPRKSTSSRLSHPLPDLISFISSLKAKGLDISHTGVSVKTQKRFDRQDYVDATQRYACAPSSLSLTSLIAPTVGVSSKLLTHPHSAAGALRQIPAVHRPMFQDPPKWTDKTRRQASKVEAAERRRRRKRACLDHESDRQGGCDASAHKLCGTSWSLGVLYPSSGEERSWSPPIPLQIMGPPVICTAGVIVNVFIIYRLYSLLSMTFISQYAGLRDIYAVVGHTSSDATTNENQPNQTRSKIKFAFQLASLSELPAVSLTATH